MISPMCVIKNSSPAPVLQLAQSLIPGRSMFYTSRQIKREPITGTAVHIRSASVKLSKKSRFNTASCQDRTRFGKRFSMRLRFSAVLLITVASALISVAAHAEPFWDLETGAVFSGYNDVRIPGDSGTRISLTEDLKPETSYFFRMQAGYTFFTKHTVSFLAAPLRLHSSGKIDRDVVFKGTTFTAGSDVSTRFRFDSYRLTYRFDFYQNESFTAGLGITAKIRDASISMSDGNRRAEKENTGFVPLVNFRLSWLFARPFGFLLEGDALAAKQGRAEDILAALTYRFSPNIVVKAGYRMLEGGADNDEVYTFSMFHYAVVGMRIVF